MRNMNNYFPLTIFSQKDLKLISKCIPMFLEIGCLSNHEKEISKQLLSNNLIIQLTQANARLININLLVNTDVSGRFSQCKDCLEHICFKHGARFKIAFSSFIPSFLGRKWLIPLFVISRFRVSQMLYFSGETDLPTERGWSTSNEGDNIFVGGDLAYQKQYTFIYKICSVY